MPPIKTTPTPNVTYVLSVSFVDTLGDRGQIRLSDIPAAATDAELVQVANSAGSLSNAEVTKITDSKITHQFAPPTPFDESESSVTTKAVFVFQNSDGQRFSVAVPAPDASITGQDGQTIDFTNSLVQDFVADVLRVYNTPNGAVTPVNTYQAIRGYIDKGRGAPPYRVKPGVTREPGAGDNPPAAPGL